MLRRFCWGLIAVGAVLMAGRSATFYLGGQANAQAAVETGLVFNPSSLAVDNNGPQTITIDNPPVVIPPYTVGRIVPVTLQSNRVKATATGLSSNGKPAALTWYEDAQAPASGNSVQAPFSNNFLNPGIIVANFTAGSYTGTVPLANGTYNCIGVLFSFVTPTQAAVGVSVSINIGFLTINGVYLPSVSYMFPVPYQFTVTNGQISANFYKSDATTSVYVGLTFLLLPAAT